MKDFFPASLGEKRGRTLYRAKYRSTLPWKSFGLYSVVELSYFKLV